MSKAGKSYVHNCDLPLPTPKLGSFHHTLTLSTSYPRTDMKGEILQGKAGLIKLQKAHPETISMQNMCCLLCHPWCNSPRLWASMSCSHITREAVLGYSVPKPHGLWASFNTQSLSLLQVGNQSECQQVTARLCRSWITLRSGIQQRQLCQELEHCSTPTALEPAHRALPQLRGHLGNHSYIVSLISDVQLMAGCVKTSWTSAPEVSQDLVTGISPGFITAR